jgi:hypothetical protein
LRVALSLEHLSCFWVPYVIEHYVIEHDVFEHDVAEHAFVEQGTAEAGNRRRYGWQLTAPSVL